VLVTVASVRILLTKHDRPSTAARFIRVHTIRSAVNDRTKRRAFLGGLVGFVDGVEVDTVPMFYSE